MANQVYLRDGSVFRAADKDSLNVQERLPVGTYAVGLTPAGWFLKKLDDMELPGKIYGDTDALAERILTTYENRGKNTGVLLSGEKGTGKTMLTKRVAQMAAERMGAITIVVNEALRGESFNGFMQGINQPAVVIFDEFEKVYDKAQQTELLTIFDGTYSSSKLFLLTCNNYYGVDQYMINRPGRIFYSLSFAGLSADFIKDYCADNLVNMANVNGVQNVAGCFSSFSFDMLKALVEEMNRYNETATAAMRFLNMKPNTESGVAYDLVMTLDDKPIVCRYVDEHRIGRSPLAMPDGYQFTAYARGKDDDEDDEKSIAKLPLRPGEITEDVTVTLERDRLLKVEPSTGTFTFGTENPRVKLVFTRALAKSFLMDYEAF